MEKNADFSAGYVFVVYGKSELFSALADSFDGFEAQMISQAIQPLSMREMETIAGDTPLYPIAWRTKGPTAFAHIPAFLQIVATLKDPFIKAVVGQAVSSIFAGALNRLKHVFPAVDGLKSKINLPLHFRPALWIASAEVLVTVTVDLSSEQDIVLAETLVPLAFERAQSWLSVHGRTNRYMTYRIEQGRLSGEPILSDDEPAK